jgi:ribosomal protein L11
MCKDLEVKHKVSITLNSQSAEAAPPLGTVLGNLGVNAIKFSKDFNEFTKDLPSYLKLRVEIFVYENKSVTFSTRMPTTGFILSLLRDYSSDNSISLDEVVKLAKFKLPYLPLEKSVPII